MFTIILTLAALWSIEAAWFVVAYIKALRKQAEQGLTR